MEVVFGAPPANWQQLDPTRYARIGTYSLAPVPNAVVAAPRLLAVLRAADKFVGEGAIAPVSAPQAPQAPSAPSALSADSAMPVRVYRTPRGIVLHVPCGMFDSPARSEYTFLDPSMRYVASTFASAPAWPESALS
jgi:hypothetical protein